jgi:hypothetical protein
MVDPQSIFSAYSGCDNAEKIRNYIKYCYQNYGGTYFILGGDDDLVPVRWCCEYVGDEDTIIPTDLYYSDLSGDWDADHDGKWGEWEDAADQFPEVFVGRITAYNSQEVQNWVTKVLNYEKTPGVLFDKAVWIYTSNVGVGSAPSAFPMHFTHLYAPDYWADAALTFLSQGNGIININCHGNAGDYYTRYGEAKHWSWRDQAPDQSNAGLNWLTNNNKYFIGYAISCYVGAYDSLAHPIYYEYGTDTCIADAYVDAYLYNHQGSIGPFGASAFLANTRNGIPGNSHNLQYAFWIRIMNPCFYPEPANTRIGVAEAYSKCDGLINWGDVYDRYICYAHTLFGSPYTEIWTKTPGNLAVTHPTQIQVNVPIPFTVTVKKSSFPQTPLQYAKVCLNKPGDIYQVGSTNSNGQVTFTVSPTSTGTLKVTVTRLHNADNNYNQYRPSQSTCQVVGGGGGQSSGEEVIKPSSLYLADVPILAQQGLTLDYGIPITGEIIVSLYDETGALVKTIIKTKKQAGYHKQIISTDNLANGIYFVVLEQNQQSISKKLLIIN